MKPTLLSVKEIALEMGVSVQSIRRAYWQGVIPGYRIHKMLRFDVNRVREIFLERGVTMPAKRSAARPAATAGVAPASQAPVR